ncbi:hypothetical protein [Anaerotignum sp.]|uniref:hypothetical protein n=1 Tax=Anaerotignum sp. TaxID=2039241 RepID=UPI00289737D5|nr:hypothetical protein [Anaerotignum sp.]
MRDTIYLKNEKRIATRYRGFNSEDCNAGSLVSQMTCINRGCTVFEIVTEFMKYMKKQEIHMKMPFFYAMLDVLKAMQLSFNLIDSSSLTYKNLQEEWFVAKMANGLLLYQSKFKMQCSQYSGHDFLKYFF